MANEISGLRFGRGLFGWVLFIALAVMLFTLLNKRQSQYAEISLGDFNRLLKDDRVSWVDIGKDNVYGEFKRPEQIRDNKVVKFRVPLPEGTTSGWQFTNWLLNNAGDAGVGVRREDDFLPKFVMPLVPWLLV